METPQKQKAFRTIIRSWSGSWQEWGSIILLFLVLEIAILSIEQAQWITPQPSLTTTLVLAILIGWVLCKSRLPDLARYPLAVIFGAMVTVWQASSLLPPSEMTPRVSQLIINLQSWWQTMSIAGHSADTTYFAVFLTLVTWTIGYISTWFLLRRQNAWVAVSLGTIAILVNLSNLSDKHYSFFFLYLVAALLLIGQSNLARHIYWFKKNSAHYSRRGTIYFMASLICLSILIVSIAWQTPEVRAYRMETLISTKIPLKKNIEEYFYNLLLAVQAKQPFLMSLEQRELLFGDSYGQGNELQFVITSEQPHYWRTRMYDIYTSSGWTSSNAEEYLLIEEIASSEAESISNRSQITYGVVTKLRTDILLTAGEFVSADTPVTVHSLIPLSFDIELSDSSHDGDLPPDVASLARSLRTAELASKEFGSDELSQLLPEDLLLTGTGTSRDNPDETSRVLPPALGNGQPTTIEVTRRPAPGRDTITVTSPRLFRPNQHYTVTASVSSVTPAELAKAGDDYPHWVTDYYLQLPLAFPERIRQLSETVTQEVESPYDKVLAIKQYLSQINYSLQVKAPPEGADGVYYFLFTEKSGNCVHFASTMAVMLRSVGVPSRLCTGYTPGEWDASTGESILRAKNRHAWPEVYFPDYGWVEFEATPGTDTETEAIAGRDDAVSDYGEEIQEPEIDEGMIGWDLGAGGTNTTPRKWPTPFLLLAIILGVLLILALSSVIASRIKRFLTPDGAHEVYSEMCFLASLMRLKPEPQQTPLEYCSELTSVFPLQTEAIDNIVQTYLENRFSRRKILMHLQRRKLQDAWHEVYPAFLRRLFRPKH